MPTQSRQLMSTLASDGTLTLEITPVELPDPKGSQVLVRIEAAPINPSDLALISMGAELDKASFSPGKVVVPLHPAFNANAGARHGLSLPVGNEGAGEVVAAGDSDAAQALVGQRVACVPGNAFGEYALTDASMCLPLGEHSSEDGASSFVNPMTALGFVETARREGHDAIIHAAAASNLGQMLNRICQADGMGLVNIVRKDEQADMLREQGATHVVNSSGDGFVGALADAIADTGAFLGFDPIGGGTTSDNCLRAMEKVASRDLDEFSRYGSEKQKKMYIYGRLELAPTILTPSYGFAWTVSGWLLFPFLKSAGMETVLRMRQRVVSELGSTFASSYKQRVGLDEMLTEDALRDYTQMKTGEKYLVTPQS